MIKLFNAALIITTATTVSFANFTVGEYTEAAAREEAYATFYDTEYLENLPSAILDLSLTITAL